MLSDLPKYKLTSTVPKLLGRKHKENELKKREKQLIENDRSELITRRRNMDQMGEIIESTNDIMKHVVGKLEMCELQKMEILNEINENNKQIFEISKVCDDEKLKLKQKIYLLKKTLKNLQKNQINMDVNNINNNNDGKIDSLNQQIRKLEMKNTALQQKLREKPVYVEGLSNKVIKEASDCRKEKEKNNELQQQLKEIYMEKNQLKQDVKESTAQNRTLVKNIKKCEEKFETVNQYVEETVTAMQTLKETLRKCTSENSDIKEAMRELQEIVRSFHQSMDETKP